MIIKPSFHQLTPTQPEHDAHRPSVRFICPIKHSVPEVGKVPKTLVQVVGVVKDNKLSLSHKVVYYQILELQDENLKLHEAARRICRFWVVKRSVTFPFIHKLIPLKMAACHQRHA